MTPGWHVDVHLVSEWLLGLDQRTYEQVVAALELLEEHGPGLGRPLVDSVVGSRYSNTKELRPGSSGRSEIRVLFAFDPRRQAVLLVGGDKAGRWRQWYQVNVRLADERYARHLDELEREGDDGDGRHAR